MLPKVVIYPKAADCIYVLKFEIGNTLTQGVCMLAKAVLTLSAPAEVCGSVRLLPLSPLSKNLFIIDFRALVPVLERIISTIRRDTAT